MTSREDTVSFNVGGRIFAVRRSLLDMHPQTILARSASKEWTNEDDSKQIFLDRDSERFRYCLDYMREGRVELPPTESKKALLQELEYYGFEDVDPNKIKSSMLGIHAINCLRLCEEKLQKTLKGLEERREHALAAYELLLMCKSCSSLELEISRSMKNDDKKVNLYDFCAKNRFKSALMDEYLKPYGLKIGHLTLHQFYSNKYIIQLDLI